MSCLLILLFAGLVALAAVEPVRVAPEHQPRVGDLVAWRLDGVDPAWLTTDCRRTPILVIGSGDDQAWRPAFLYRPHRTDPTHRSGEFTVSGPDTLHIRHVFRRPGHHRWKLLAPDDDHPLAEGSLEVAAGAGPVGPIHVSPANPRLLAFADGTPFISLGTNLAWATGRDRLATWSRQLERFAAAGGNHVRVWCASWFAQIEGDRADDYRLDQAWLLDRVLALARRHGVRVTLVVDNHHDFTQGSAFPYGEDLVTREARFLAAPPGAQYERRVRYLLARYGADDTVLAWELFNEIDLTYAERWRIATWVDAAAALWRRLDQDGRPRTISTSLVRWFEVHRSPDLDLVQIHQYVLEPELQSITDHDGIGLLLDHIPRLVGLRRAACFSEVGYNGREDHHPLNHQDPDGLLFRRQLWAGFLLGGYGTGMAWWWDVYLDQRDLWRYYRPLANLVATIDWRDPSLRPLAVDRDQAVRLLGWRGRRQALLWPLVNGDTWHARLVAGIDPTWPTEALRVAGFQADDQLAISYYDLRDGRLLGFRLATPSDQGGLVLELTGPPGETIYRVGPAD